MPIIWDDEAWEAYLWWQANDRKTLARINTLIKQAKRAPFEGIGKPEPLRGDRSGYWSRRIDQANRLVYKVSGDTIRVASCRDHYAD